MARGKYEAKKRVGANPPAVPGRGVALSVPANAAKATTSSRSHAASAAGTPVLGVAVMSNWGWRIMAVAVLVAFGLAVTFLLDGHTVIGAFWVLIALAWGFFTLKLWRMHLAWDAGR
ncbi:MAG TPA: hypothetical protein VME46_12205 [Acidimicrobiales bacterium]|nr:hypothetical protein [Acidimicrobiales bacterium]